MYSITQAVKRANKEELFQAETIEKAPSSRLDMPAVEIQTNAPVQPPSLEDSEPEPIDPALCALISEAIVVINDMLEVGVAASIFSNNTAFNGFIIATPDARPPYR